MGWYFRDENPPLRDQLFVHYLVVCSVSLIFGMWADFVPENWIIRLGSYISIIPGIAGLYWIIHQVFIKKFHEGLGFSRVRLAGAIIAAPFFSYFLFWMLIVHTIPALYTYCVGSEYSQVSEIEKYYGSSTKECRYQLKSEDLKGSFPSYVCVSERFYDATHSHVKFIGKRSSAGKLFQQAQTCR